MESGTIVRWLKSEGDSVKMREPLYELDTDKVTQEVESDFDGVLLTIVVREGEVQVGSTIALIESAAAEAAAPDVQAAPVAAVRNPRPARKPLLPRPRSGTAMRPLRSRSLRAAGSRLPRSPGESHASAAST